MADTGQSFPNTGITGSQYDTRESIDKQKTNLWKYFFLGCSGLILVFILVIGVLIFYLHKNRTNIIPFMGNMFKRHVMEIMDKDVPKEKQNLFVEQMDAVINKLNGEIESKEISSVGEKLEPFFRKFSKFQDDMKISEPEVDELIKELEKILEIPQKPGPGDTSPDTLDTFNYP